MNHSLEEALRGELLSSPEIVVPLSLRFLYLSKSETWKRWLSQFGWLCRQKSGEELSPQTVPGEEKASFDRFCELVRKWTSEGYMSYSTPLLKPLKYSEAWAPAAYAFPTGRKLIVNPFPFRATPNQEDTLQETPLLTTQTDPELPIGFIFVFLHHSASSIDRSALFLYVLATYTNAIVVAPEFPGYTSAPSFDAETWTLSDTVQRVTSFLQFLWDTIALTLDLSCAPERGRSRGEEKARGQQHQEEQEEQVLSTKARLIGARKVWHVPLQRRTFFIGQEIGCTIALHVIKSLGLESLCPGVICIEPMRNGPSFSKNLEILASSPRLPVCIFAHEEQKGQGAAAAGLKVNLETQRIFDVTRRASPSRICLMGVLTAQERKRRGGGREGTPEKKAPDIWNLATLQTVLLDFLIQVCHSNFEEEKAGGGQNCQSVTPICETEFWGVSSRHEIGTKLRRYQSELRKHFLPASWSASASPSLRYGANDLGAETSVQRLRAIATKRGIDLGEIALLQVLLNSGEIFKATMIPVVERRLIQLATEAGVGILNCGLAVMAVFVVIFVVLAFYLLSVWLWNPRRRELKEKQTAVL